MFCPRVSGPVSGTPWPGSRFLVPALRRRLGGVIASGGAIGRFSDGRGPTNDSDFAHFELFLPLKHLSLLHGLQICRFPPISTQLISLNALKQIY